MGAAAPEPEHDDRRFLFLSVVFVLFTPLVFMACSILGNPDMYVQDLYVPSLVPELNKTTAFNASVFVDLKFERDWSLTGYNYEDLRMSLFYGEYEKNSSVGTHMVPGFSMDGKRRVHTKVAMEAVGMPWQEAIRATSAGNVVAMVVEMAVSTSGYIKPDVFVAHVWVDASGHMFSNKPIELMRLW